ncbi:MAG: hypothetical protein WB792_00380 [Desulfobacterales bacterium]
MVKPEDIRKQYLSIFFAQSIAFKIYLFLAFLFLMPSTAALAGNKPHTGDELISLTAKDEPLGDVLNKISMATGCEIDLNQDWRDYLVSVTLEKVPLHKGLKRILKDLNNVIVYVSSKKIKIIIYDKVSPDRGSSAPSNPNERSLISPKRSYHPPAPDIPDSQALEKEEAPPENPGASGEESEIDTDNYDESRNKKVENFKTTPDKRTPANLEDKSSKGRSGQSNQSGSSSGEDTDSSQRFKSSSNNE